MENPEETISKVSIYIKAKCIPKKKKIQLWFNIEMMQHNFIY